MPDHAPVTHETELYVGPSAITGYSRLPYTLWHALAEFVDNSTQSRANYGDIIDEVLKSEGMPLKVDIVYNRETKVLTITDNSIGMTRADLVDALKIAQVTQDSKGRSKYGMGLKTAACWIGDKWSVTTSEWSSGEQWTADVDVQRVAKGDVMIPLRMESVNQSTHGTTITVRDLNRNIQRRTEEVVMQFLGSMYRMDIRAKRLALTFNGNPVPLPEQLDLAKSEDGTEQREEFETTIGGKRVFGWFGVLLNGGRKYGGFSLFQNERQIKGFPDAWKPKSVFGGVDDEGSNTLVAQRLTGEINLDGFEVSHTKDAILYRGNEEEELERFLVDRTQKLKLFAQTMRKGARTGSWSKEKVKELLEGMRADFSSAEMKDAVNGATIPPLAVIEAANQLQSKDLNKADELWSVEVGAGMTVRVYLQDRSPNDPHLTLASDRGGALNVIINLQHPYYMEIESSERTDELIRQYIYDSVAEYKVSQKIAAKPPDAIRLLKNTLLRAKIERIHNAHEERQRAEVAKLDH